MRLVEDYRDCSGVYGGAPSGYYLAEEDDLAEELIDIEDDCEPYKPRHTLESKPMVIDLGAIREQVISIRRARKGEKI